MRYLIDCRVERPDWPFIPVTVACGSARTLGVVGLNRPGVTITGCRVRITNADGQALAKDCVFRRGVWLATFPAEHFENYGTVKNGVVVFSVGKDELGESQSWVERVGDLIVKPVDASNAPGSSTAVARDVYLRSAVVNGVQHYKKEILTYSALQGEWGAEYVGDYVLVAGEYVPVVENDDGEGDDNA